MYLIDTNVISEARKKGRADPGVRRFLHDTVASGASVYLSVVTLGELRRGTEMIRYRGDEQQANQLEAWLDSILRDYKDAILPLDKDVVQLWGYLRVPHAENALDKLIAATALLYGLTVVTRNENDFCPTGANVLNPFVY